jgi:serine/threonine protein kinase
MGQNTSNQKQENKSLLVDDGMIFSRDSKKVTLEDFAILKLVGKGNFAKVFQVRKKDTDSIYAMKILSKSGLKKANQLDHIKTERVILGNCFFFKIQEYSDFPFMVHLVYAFQTDDKLYMVMDFVNGGELFFHLKKSRRFKEERAKYYAAEIFLGLNHLHNQNIIYRDLKPENVLMDKDGHVLLTGNLQRKFLKNKILDFVKFLQRMILELTLFVELQKFFFFF